jgi:hypothetical protein
LLATAVVGDSCCAVEPGPPTKSTARSSLCKAAAAVAVAAPPMA